MALSETQVRLALFDERIPRTKLLGQAACFAAWTGITLVGATLHPFEQGHGTHQQLGLPPCPSVLLFDRPCPGCGLTTSWSALIHGNLPLAFHAHPLGPLMYLIFTVIALMSGYGFIAGRRLRTYSDAFNRASTVVAVGFILFGIARFALMPHFGSVYERQLARFTKLR